MSSLVIKASQDFKKGFNTGYKEIFIVQRQSYPFTYQPHDQLRDDEILLYKLLSQTDASFGATCDILPLKTLIIEGVSESSFCYMPKRVKP